MPKPIGAEPETVPIHEQVRQLTRQAHTDRMAPIGITFTNTGYSLAQSQTVPGMTAWGGQSHVAETYLGLPFAVVADAPFRKHVDLVLVPGSSEEAKAFRDTKRAALPPEGQRLASVNHTFRRDAVSIRVDHLDPRKTTMEVVAVGLTRHALCDILQHWCNANPSDDMVPGLRRVVQQYGSFE